MKGELPPNAQRKMGPVGWEGRAPSCGAEVSGCSGTGLSQGWGSEQAWRRAAGGRSGSDASLRGAWRHMLSSGVGAGAVFQAWVWYPGGNCQKESHQAAMGHASCPPPLGIPRY